MLAVDWNNSTPNRNLMSKKIIIPNNIIFIWWVNINTAGSIQSFSDIYQLFPVNELIKNHKTPWKIKWVTATFISLTAKQKSSDPRPSAQLLYESAAECQSQHPTATVSPLCGLLSHQVVMLLSSTAIRLSIPPLIRALIWFASSLYRRTCFLQAPKL